MSAGAAAAGYRGGVLRLPHARGVFAAALLGRLSLAMISLGLLLTVQRSTGSYAIAGAATALFGVANVVIAPARARLVDRRGPGRILIILAAGYAAGLLALAGLAGWAAPTWSLLAAAAVAGFCAPPLGAVMRGLWAVLAPDPATLSRAYSLDAVAEELLFVTGPLVVGAVVLVAPPAITLLLGAGLAVGGAVGMTRSPAAAVAAAPVPVAPTSTRIRPLRQAGFWPVLMALFGVGVVLGTIEVVVPALAQQHHHVAAAGALLALLSLGSAVRGLFHGHRTWSSTPVVRLLVFTAALVVASATLVAAQQILLFALVLIVVGLFLAPALIVGYLLAGQLVPAAARTEASTWITTASNAGAAASAALVGYFVDRSGIGAALAVGTALAAACTALGAIGIRIRNR